MRLKCICSKTMDMRRKANALTITLQNFNRAVAMATACHAYGPSALSAMERFNDWAALGSFEGIRISNNSVASY